MSIQFIASEHIFQLNAGDSSLILRIADENYLLTLYYGKALPFGSPSAAPLTDTISATMPHRSPRATLM